MRNLIDLDAKRVERQEKMAGTYEEGWHDAMEFVEQRVSELLALTPEAREVFFELVESGYAPGLPPTIVMLIRKGVGTWS
ncbi:hypothetical protein [Symbiobacterium thermophilum]|uniref:Uncharacterized protein n=1 Tax=Symbiobacterium thermophilum TaxID=2734 RepID=A0A953I9T9_SYMTR|nr:hypothetical protein [Symbiobacterium thermophilum]MBY6275394.1 hypothetical protein [Symbiobacterium thermophilum]